jgi:hypothetical protein
VKLDGRVLQRMKVREVVDHSRAADQFVRKLASVSSTGRHVESVSVEIDKHVVLERRRSFSLSLPSDFTYEPSQEAVPLIVAVE